MTYTLPRPLPMSSFVRFTARVAAFAGFIFGLIGLFWSILGQPVFIAFGPMRIDGLPAGMLGVALMPVIFTLGGALLGLLVYLPIRLVLWLLWR